MICRKTFYEEAVEGELYFGIADGISIAGMGVLVLKITASSERRSF